MSNNKEKINYDISILRNTDVTDILRNMTYPYLGIYMYKDGRVSNTYC